MRNNMHSNSISDLASANDRGSAGRTPVNQQKPLLLCLSHLRWDFVFQRPQHLLTRAANSFRVLFFEEPVFDGTSVPRLEMSQREHGITVAVPHLPHGHTPTENMRLQRELIDDLLAVEGQPAVLWYYSPMAMSFTSHLDAPVCIYDCMDELSAFRGAPPDLRLWEHRLFSKADFVLAGGRSLYQSKRTQHSAVTLLPSSIDTVHFDKARRNPAEPADLANIPHPRIGFFGVIDERLDTELVGKMAALKPDWQFVMIGPVVKIDPETLPKAANIHWLGGKSYKELPDYLGNWTMGMMPFAMNESTRFISPTKTPEFLAAGLPVVSTPVADVVVPYGEAKLVAIASTAEEFVAELDKLMDGSRESWMASVDKMLAANSWAKSWARVEELIRSVMIAKIEVATNEMRATRMGKPAEAGRARAFRQVPVGAREAISMTPGSTLAASGKE